jgi:hypothetical protein
MESTSGQLQTAVSEVLRHLALPALESFSSTVLDQSSQHAYPSFNGHEEFHTEMRASARGQEQERRTSQSATMAMTRENSQERQSFGEPGSNVLIAAPMGSLYEVTKLRNLRSNPHGYFQQGPAAPLEDKDFISSGEISLEEAEEMFQIFERSLNQYLWGGIVLVHKDLLSVRRSSSLLLAAILTVTALHIPGKSSTFDVCYAEFLDLVSASMLDRYHTLDGIRGLCIGAFWLSDVSC